MSELQLPIKMSQPRFHDTNNIKAGIKLPRLYSWAGATRWVKISNKEGRKEREPNRYAVVFLSVELFGE